MPSVRGAWALEKVRDGRGMVDLCVPLVELKKAMLSDRKIG